jgi:membrane protease YdiL (CAAX protease family)
MSGHDEQDPIHNNEFPDSDLRDPNLPSSALQNHNTPSKFAPWLDGPSPDAPSTHPPAEDLTDEPTFNLPAIPIAPLKPINTPISRVLASGDDLLDFVRDPLARPAPKPAQRMDFPNDLDPELFTKPPSSDLNRPASTGTRADHLADALRPEASGSDTDSAFENYPAPDFPITPFAPFNAPLHAQPFPDHSSGDQQTQIDPTLDTQYPIFHTEPEAITRIPNIGHLGILIIIASLGFIAAAIFVQAVFRLHLWGVTTINKAATDIHYTLASMAVLYIVAFALAFFVFPRLWHKPFFAALQWNAPAARRYLGWLIGAAFFCFLLAMLDELVIPGPTNAPIDKMFSNTSAAWLLFAFGVTVAPFFEEMTFRGFLLPALCTAIDWAISERNHQPMLPLGPNGHPQWSRAAMIAGSLLTSLPFAAMHAEQIAHSIGPLLLLYCVSLVLCAARLFTRSLAASTLLHSTYNFLLFFMMMVGTGGFKHLDKM